VERGGSYCGQDYCTVKRSIFLTPLFLGVLASSALAAELSIKGNVKETLNASDNYFMSKTPSGYTAKSLSALNLSTLAATPTTRYLLDSHFSYFTYFGPGAKDTNLTWATPMSEAFHVDHTTPLSKYNFAASWRRVDVVTANLAQIGTASGRGTQDNYSLTGGVTRQLSHLDSVSWTANGATVSYSEPGQTPYVDFSSTLGWNHNLTRTIKLTQSLYFDWYFSNNTANTQRLFWKPTSAVDAQLSKRLHLSASVGMIFLNAYQNGSVPSVVSSIFSNTTPVNGTGFQPMIGAGNGWVANVALNYKLFPDTQVGLTASRAVTPTITGQLTGNESIAATLKYEINHSSDLSMRAQFSRTISATGGNSSATSPDFFSVSANYSYKLTRNWRTSLSYAYRQRNDQSGSVHSNTVLFSLMRDFTLFGKPPTSAPKTPSELAQEEIARTQLVFPGLAPY
jgi:Putative beta-barrel porin 2